MSNDSSSKHGPSVYNFATLTIRNHDEVPAWTGGGSYVWREAMLACPSEEKSTLQSANEEGSKWASHVIKPCATPATCDMHSALGLDGTTGWLRDPTEVTRVEEKFLADRMSTDPTKSAAATAAAWVFDGHVKDAAEKETRKPVFGPGRPPAIGVSDGTSGAGQSSS